jgi:hypothetical protein
MFLLLILVSFGALANDKTLKICLTGSTEKAIPQYGDAFHNGAKLAFNELSKSDKKRVELLYSPHDTTPLAPLRKLNELKDEACDAIVGFSTGNDLISIEDRLKNNPIFTLSIYGDPQPRFSRTNYLRTMQPSSQELVDHLLTKVKIKKRSKILMVTTIDRSEMTSYRDAFLSRLSKQKNQITQIEVLEQAKDLRMLKKIVAKDKIWDYLILLTRANIAAEISDIINEHSSPIILGNKYMGSSELPAFLNFLKNKKVNAYFSRQNCTCSNDAQYQAAVKRYVNVFGVKPMAISIDTYDAVKFILQSLKLKDINPISVIKFLNSSDASYNGPSSLSVSTGLKLKVTSRFLIHVDENGYKDIQ